MSGTLLATANDILNQVGAEVGLDPVNDPFAANDQSYKQLSYLINAAGEELSQLYPWQFLRKEATITTTLNEDEYALPNDYLYMLNQTMWDRTNDNPVYGPLSPQEWSEMYGRETTTDTLFLHFRIKGNTLCLFPDTIAAGLDIRYEYISRNWVLQSGTSDTYTDKCTTGGDTPQFNRTLLGRMLKVKFLEAKGFDTTKAQADLNQAFELITAHSKSAPILCAGRRRGKGYLGYRNVPDTGYGG